VISGAHVGTGTVAGPFYRSCSNGPGILNWNFGGRPHCRKAAI